MNTITRKRYTEADCDPFIGKSGESNRGLLPLPNAEDVDPLAFLNNLASGGHMMLPKWGYAIIVDPHGGHQRQQWTQFFLLSDGEGYAVTYGGTRWEKNAEGNQVGIDTPIVRRFAICKHEKTDTGTPDGHRRGWHPGHCAKCGTDMSYDSGD